MTTAQLSIFIILAVTMTLFVWNYWRYDIVAGLALMACVFTGVVPVDHAFEGFSHPAVITVACVLVISQALQSSGVVGFFLGHLGRFRQTPRSQLAANCTITSVLSAFMNNIGALALMLPITMRDARKAKRAASTLLMPLSFASLLGGLVTLIGTPPNIIISTVRADHTGEAFSMFDFTPVGIVVAFAGIAFLVLASRFLLPSVVANDSDNQSRIARYLTEVVIRENSKLTGQTVGHLESLCENEATVMAIIRHNNRRLAPSTHEIIRTDDILILQGDSEALQPLFEDTALVHAGAELTDPGWLKSPDVIVIEAVVMPNSMIEGLASRSINMHKRFSVNLLGIAREDHPTVARLKHIRVKTGDVLLLQGEKQALEQLCASLGCLAIKNRGMEITPKRAALTTPLVFGAGILATAVGLLPVQIAFAAVVGALVLLKAVSLREAYRSIEWPVIVLLGFLIPVGEALQSTGATGLIANALVAVAQDIPLWALLALIMITSMGLSDLVHNTPTAILMAPIALSLADTLAISADPLLMAVAIGAASPYLTPVGHQSNTLVLGPGGYQFSDYWRLGLPLDMVILLVAVPMILLVWG
ncbi:MAG: SLC13 family permease [Pseudomonadota bacterium]